MGKIPVQISTKGLLASTLYHSILYTSSPLKIPKQDLYGRSHEISMSECCKASLSRSLHKSSLISKMSTVPQLQRCENPNQRGGCVSDPQTSTAPRWERSERPKVTRRGFRATVSCETSFENRRWRIFCVVRLRVTIFAGHGSQAQVLCESSVKNGRRRGYFCAVRVIKNGAHLWDHLDTPPNPYHKNPKRGGQKGTSIINQSITPFPLRFTMPLKTLALDLLVFGPRILDDITYQGMSWCKPYN